MPFKEFQDLLVQLIDTHGLIYLVGGYVRDACINQTSSDFDLVFESNAIAAGRTVADFFHGDFFILDPKRGTGRALFHHDGKDYRADCALLNPLGIVEDLRNRDFTVNAMAVQAPDFSVLIDPLGGLYDLENHHLRLCNPNGFLQDPVRVFRAVRFSNDLDLQMNAELTSLLNSANDHLSEVSNERIRDEIINILNTKCVRESVQRINDLDLLDHVFPGLKGLFSIHQALPHVHDGWNHTLEVVNYCQILIDALLTDTSQPFNTIILEAVKVIKKFQMGMRTVLSEHLNPFRDMKALFYIAALYHDTGKPFLLPVQQNEKTSYPGHEKIGKKLVQDFCLKMAFSNRECQFIGQIVAGHMQPITINTSKQNTFRRSAYHFFNQTGLAGVFICILHLADIIATYEQTISQERWKNALNTAENLLDIWFNHYDDVVNPPRLINGVELQQEFGITPGKKLGELLERLREEQAAGEISDIQQAYRFIKQVFNEVK